jgi:hypothetical protein
MALVWPLRHKRNYCSPLAGAKVAKVAEADGFSLNNRNKARAIDPSPRFRQHAAAVEQSALRIFSNFAPLKKQNVQDLWGGIFT